MCNVYENLSSKSQIKRTIESLGLNLKTTPATDNLREQKTIYPDQDAPILINADEGNLELTMARWGFPPIPSEKSPITNIRNLKSKWWRDVNRDYLLKKEYRCLVPFTAFGEPVRNPTWFKVPEADVSYFAGIWRPWQGERLAEQAGQTRRVRESRDWRLYAFLTTEANDVVRPIHEKAMPVILTKPDEQREWLGGGIDSLCLQRPLPNHELAIRV